MYITEELSPEQMSQLKEAITNYPEEEMEPLTIMVRLIEEFSLVVRPSLIGSHWFSGEFKAVTGDGKIICTPETIIEAPSMERAVFWAALKTMEANKGVIIGAANGTRESEREIV